MDQKTIRFIDSHYNDLFHIPDGGRIRITRGNGEELIRQCKYIDGYHLSLHKEGDEYGNTFHICEFAEICERNGNTYEPIIENEYSLDALNADNTFRPDNNITRAEVVAIVNRVTGRSADTEYINKNMSAVNVFTDLKDKSYWAFYEILEAANTHSVVTGNKGEVWVR